MKSLRTLRRSYFMRRIAAIVLAALLVFALVTLGLYNVLSPRLFMQAKQRELLPRAQYMAEQAATSYGESGTWQELGKNRIIGSDQRQWGATAILFDTETNIVETNRPLPGIFFDAGADAMNLRPIVEAALSGREVSRRWDAANPQDPGMEKHSLVGVVLVGVPVRVEGEIVGAVVMFSELEEIMGSVDTLTKTLTIGGLGVLALMMPLVYISSRRVSRPLEKMRDVALKMAGGDFAVVADMRADGEVGELAGALNYLSGELKQTVSELTAEKNRALSIVNALDEGIQLLDPEGNVLQENLAMESLLGAAYDERKALPAAVREQIRAALASRSSEEITFALSDVQIRLTVIPMDEARDGMDGAILVFRDETQAYRLEQTRREYVANVSHELRTPLTAVRALIEPLRDGMVKDEDKRQELYETILRETLRLSRLVNDMLKLSRLQSGTVPLDKITFPLEPILRETADVYGNKAREGNHTLQLVLPEAPLPEVFGNADRTEQVLVTLLDNAVCHTPPGTLITLGVRVEARAVRVIVEDTGGGIAAEDLPHVFERFYKADKSHGGGGNGLGLAIAKEMIERLGEDIGVENRDSGGARFWFTVRRADAAAKMAR